VALIGTRRERIIQAAERLVARGRLRAAIREYRKALKHDPEDTNTLNRVGDLFARLNEVPEAVDLFRQIAGLYERDGFSVKAIAIYKKILRLDASQFDVHGTLGDLYRRQGLVIEARAQYSVLAEEQRARHDLEGARGLHRKMLELEPRGVGNMPVLIDLLSQAGELEEAREGYRFMAGRMLDHGDADGAERLYLSALDSAIGNAALAAEAVDQLRREGHAKAGDRLLSAALERYPDEAARTDRVGVEIEPETEPAPEPEVGMETVARPEPQGSPAAAVEEPAPRVDSPPTPLPAAKEVEADELELDLEQLERRIVAPEPEVAAASSDESTATSELLAEVSVFVKYGMDDKAVERLEAILEEFPGDPAALDQLVRVHLEKERFDAALAPAKQLAARAAEPQVAPLWERLTPELRAVGFVVAAGRVGAPKTAEARAAEPQEAPPAPPATASVEENVAWLEELAQETRAVEPERMFDSEDEFFDLAA
jgi:tetratricopeptide (TPR) repeat protein